MATISIGGLKGGSSRSTTAVQLSTYFAHLGKSVLVIDTDTNQSVAQWSGLRPDDLPEVTVVGMMDNRQLSRNFKKLQANYDIVIIDGSPTMSEKASYIILLADLLILPTPISGFDIWAQEKFIDRYLEAQTIKGKDIPAYFLLAMYNPRVNLHREFREELKAYQEEYNIGTLKSYLEYRISYRLATIQGKSGYEWNDPKAKIEVKELGDEILKILNVYELIWYEYKN